VDRLGDTGPLRRGQPASNATALIHNPSPPRFAIHARGGCVQINRAPVQAYDFLGSILTAWWALFRTPSMTLAGALKRPNKKFRNGPRFKKKLCQAHIDEHKKAK
jgi:hypothetical protein